MISHLARALRIENDYLRVLALMLLFLPELFIYTVHIAQYGPSRRRLRTLGFYLAPMDLFLAGMRGDFVGLPIHELER